MSIKWHDSCLCLSPACSVQPVMVCVIKCATGRSSTPWMPLSLLKAALLSKGTCTSTSAEAVSTAVYHGNTTVNTSTLSLLPVLCRHLRRYFSNYRLHQKPNKAFDPDFQLNCFLTAPMDLEPHWKVLLTLTPYKAEVMSWRYNCFWCNTSKNKDVKTSSTS